MKGVFARMILAVCVVGGFSPMVCPAAESVSNVYVSWENMEIDKCASAWLIKRFVDKNAVFKFVPKGELVTEGIPFDVPEAEIRRYHNMSAFEYVVRKNGIKDSAVRKLAGIIHDIEINYWGKRKFEESQRTDDAGIRVILFPISRNLRPCSLPFQFIPEQPAIAFFHHISGGPASFHAVASRYASRRKNED